MCHPAGQRKRKDTYRCPECPRVCFSMRGYSNHLTSKHDGDAKKEPLVCPTCDQEFKTPYNLKRHAANAHDPLDFNCKGCRKSFKTSLSLKRHFARYHGYIECPSCARKFTRHASLRRHARTAHPGVVVNPMPSTSRDNDPNLPHSCGKCGKSFNRKYNLMMHARRCGTTSGGGVAAKMVGGGGVTHTESDSWRVTKLNTGRNDYFRLSRWNYEFTMKENLLEPPPTTWKEMILRSGVYFDELVGVITENIPDGDRLGVVITHSAIDFPINCGVRERSAFTSKALLNEIARVVQSFRAFRLADPFTVSVKQVGVDSGGNDGVGWEAYPTRDIALDRKRTVIKIHNTDNLCLTRAIAVGIVYCEFKEGVASKEDWDRCKDGGVLQLKIAEFLMAAAGLPRDKKCSVVDTDAIARILPMGGGPERLFAPGTSYTINVYGTDGDFEPLFRGGRGKSVINVILRDGHFDAVLSLAALKGVKMFCDYCQTVIMRDRPHKCYWVCSACDSFVDDVHGRAPDEVTDKRCRRCLKIFYNAVCKQRHRDKCVRICRECKKPDVEGHKCGDVKIYCRRCRVSYAKKTTHTCYMRPDSTRRQRGQGRSMVFFDMESCYKPLIQKMDGEGTYECEHLPIFIGARKICAECTKGGQAITDHLPQGCGDCADVTFSGVDAVEHFVLWLFEPGQRDSVVISHSGGRYDCVLLLKSLYRHHRKIKFTPKGAGFISIDLPSSRIRFLDSYLFISYPLAKFPKIFGFPEGEAKGFFPYSFLTPDTLRYLGDVPDKTFFPTNKYDVSAMEEFDKWHGSFGPGGYDIREEIRKYCVQDVKLLCRGWTQFRKMFIEECETDPNDRVTISSTCNAYFRNKCMKPESMALLPNNERLVPNDVQSDIAKRYLLWLEGELGVRFWMSGRGRGEKKVGGYKLDAYDPKTRRGWDVLGCYFHGCPTCYKRTTVVAGGRKAEEVYLESRYRKSKIVRRLSAYGEIWEHDIRAKMRTDASMREKMEKMEIVSPMNVREALFGGRVEVFRLYYDAAAEGRGGLSYADINSLYPTVMRSNPYPTGKPVHLSGRRLKKYLRRVNNGDLPWKGLIKCKALAPGTLHVPVLPRRDEENDKCMFTLCRTCPSDPPEDGICRHTDEERAFIGAWTHCELELAIAKGYEVLALYEVWSWPADAWRDDLFRDYIDRFIAMKVQASGWPRPGMTEEEREDYLAEYLLHEGIALDKEKMEFNAGLRVFCKICVNCLWGYLCQRGNKYQQCFHSSRASFLKHLVDDKIYIRDIHETGEAMKILTVFKDLADHVQNSRNVNAVYGVFTTSYARISLYKHLDRLGKRLVYCDTDSIVYMPPDDDNAYEPPMHAHFLGKFKDELPPGEEISEWVATAPKSYAYRLKKSGETKVVMKGVHVDAATRQLLGFDELKKLLNDNVGTVGGEGSKITIPVADFFVRDSTRGRIYTRKSQKTINFNYDKRHVDSDDFTTWPFGRK